MWGMKWLTSSRWRSRWRGGENTAGAPKTFFRRKNTKKIKQRVIWPERALSGDAKYPFIAFFRTFKRGKQGRNRSVSRAAAAVHPVSKWVSSTLARPVFFRTRWIETGEKQEGAEIRRRPPKPTPRAGPTHLIIIYNGCVPAPQTSGKSPIHRDALVTGRVV